MLMVWCVKIREQICFTLRDICAVIGPPLLASTVMVVVIYGFRFMSVPLLNGKRFFDILLFAAMILVGGATYTLGMYLCHWVFPGYRLFETVARTMRN
jgi:hypothetical protein